MAASNPVYAFSGNITKFNLLLEHRGEEAALSFFRENLEENRQGGYVLADALLKSSKTFKPTIHVVAWGESPLAYLTCLP